MTEEKEPNQTQEDTAKDTKKPDEPKKLTFSDLRSLGVNNWKDSIETTDPQKLPDIYHHFYSNYFYYPNPTIHKYLMIAYVLNPTFLSNHYPLLLITGRSGSGKSELGKLAAKLRGTKPYLPNDTFASIRNSIKASGSDRTILVWDDIDSRQLNPNTDFYTMFKVTYDRGTAMLQIASERGENIVFNCFCPKIVATTHPLYSPSQYPELSRRLLLINTSKTPSSLPSLNHVNFAGISELYWDYWNYENCVKWVELKKQLFYKMDFLDPLEKIISVDIVTTISLCLNQYIFDPIQWIKNYWEWHRNFIGESDMDIFSSILKEYLGDKKALLANALKKYLMACYSNGELPDNPTNKVIHDWMTNNGYIFNPKSKQWERV